MPTPEQPQPTAAIYETPEHKRLRLEHERRILELLDTLTVKRTKEG